MAISPIGLHPQLTIQPENQCTQPSRLEIAATNRDLSKVTKFLNDTAAAGTSREFSISIDPATRQAVVRIIDKATKEIVDQLPSEYLLHIAQQLNEILTKKAAHLADKTLRE